MRSKSVGPALAVLFLVNVLNFYDRQTLAAILEPLRHEFSLSDTQLGGLFTLFTVVFALAGLPLGKLADTRSRRDLLAAGIALWTGLTGLAGLATSYAMLLGTRLGVGIGEAVCTPAATSWIGDLVPASRRARAMAGFMMAVPVGIMLSSAISGPVAQAYGWRMALMLAAIPGLVLAPAVLCLREPERPRSGGCRRGYRGAARRVLVDCGLRRRGQFRALQLLHLPAGVSDALSRHERGAGGNLDGDWLGSLGNPGRWRGGLMGDRVKNRLWLAAGASLAGGGPAVRRDSHAGRQRRGRGLAGDDRLRPAADVLRAGVRGDSGCRRARRCGAARWRSTSW